MAGRQNLIFHYKLHLETLCIFKVKGSMLIPAGMRVFFCEQFLPTPTKCILADFVQLFAALNI